MMHVCLNCQRLLKTVKIFFEPYGYFPLQPSSVEVVVKINE